ncbi:hypothetical protein PENSTE_c006G05576 [Penicillium steckii]|uniref:HTH CENPB-type domain-containing protein n=1 Tax=Penicillium steckii TaxID=303698 RepID=A0A1V6TH55_9EURO|nr:hypothetical protein PENSTE_c006G05576 [Penicillium steckii]
MPPIRSQKRPNAGNKARKEHVSQTSKNAKFDEISDSTTPPHVSHHPLTSNTQQRAAVRAVPRKLTQPEEQSLIEWMIDFDKRGFPLKRKTVKDMADILLRNREDAVPQKVSYVWVKDFISRTPSIARYFEHGYDRWGGGLKARPRWVVTVHHRDAHRAEDPDDYASAMDLLSQHPLPDSDDDLLEKLRKLRKALREVNHECKLIMQGVEDVRAAYAERESRRSDEGRLLHNEGGLTFEDFEEGRKITAETKKGTKTETGVYESENQRPRQRCGLCREPGHKRNRCPGIDIVQNED